MRSLTTSPLVMVCLGVLLGVVVGSASSTARADREDAAPSEQLPPIFRVGAQLKYGAPGMESALELTVLDVKGKWIQGRAPQGVIVWMAADAGGVWTDSTLGKASTPGGGPAGPGAIAQVQMANLSQAINMYYMENRKLPQSLEDLTKEEPKTGERWMDSIPKDPWGQPYDYRISGKKFTLRSYGPDLQEGTADDIVWPKDE